MPGSHDDGDLRALFRRHIKGHWQRVDGIPGVPDTNYCIDGTEGWIEFKATRYNAVKFRSTQPSWLMRRSAAGGRGWVAIRRWRLLIKRPIDQLWMVPGHLAVDLSRHGLPMGTLVGENGPDRWNWALVRSLLISVMSPVSTSDQPQPLPAVTH